MNQGILNFLRKNSFQEVIVHIYTKEQELKQCHTLSQRSAVCLKATFSKECHTLLKAILCIHVTPIDTFYKISYRELCYLKIVFCFCI